MADRMAHRAKVGDFCIITRGQWGVTRYTLRRVASVSVDGWIESTRTAMGRNERLRAPDETIYLVALRPNVAHIAEALVRRCESRKELIKALRPLRDETVSVDDQRVDGSRVDA